MKKYIFTVVLMLIVISCGSTSNETQMQDELVIVAVAEQEEKSPVYITVFIPIIQKETSYYETDFIKSTKEYEYDGERLNKITEKDTYGDLIETIIYEYKGSPFPVKELFYDNSGEMTGYNVLEHDDKGNLLSSISFDSKGNKKLGNNYSYDDNSNKISWEIIDELDNTMSTTSYTYDNGLNIKIENMNSAGELEEYYEIEYKDKNPVKKSSYTAKGVIMGTEEFKYSDGMLIQRVYNRANGSTRRIEKYEYDEHGSPVKIEYTDSSGKVQEMVLKEYAYREETREVEGE